MVSMENNTDIHILQDFYYYYFLEKKKQITGERGLGIL